MSDLRQLQQSFFGHLVASPTDIAEHIQSTAVMSADDRLELYASGYRLRLKEAISTDYDRLYSYLGDEMFEQLMDAYIDAYQSHHPSLRYYSQHMTELLSQQAPFSDYPELLELAKIEQAFNDSFDAATCTTVGIERISELAQEDWPLMTIKFHSSIRVLHLDTNSFQIWKALSEDQSPPALVNEFSNWVIWRKNLVSRYRALSEPEAVALDLVLKGTNFSELCEKLLDYFDEEQTPVQAITYLQTWINEKMVCQLQ